MINIPLVLITSLQISLPTGKVHYAPAPPPKHKPAIVAPVVTPPPVVEPEPNPDPPAPDPEPVAPAPPPSLPAAPAYSYANTYAYGYCTWYVASVKNIPGNWGNANTWAYNASAQGYTVSSNPIVGAVAQNTTDSYLGHVALVIAVANGQVLLSEMNAVGFGVISERWANAGHYQYIYV